MKNKIILTVVAVVALIVGTVVITRAVVTDTPALGIGTNPIENYVPAIKYNDGYYSLLDITTTGNFTVAGITTTGATVNTGSFKLGTNGTAATKMIFTSPNFGESNRCDWILAGGGTSGLVFAATSTRSIDCAVTGVTVGDSIVASLPTTTPSVFGGVRIVGVNASSTAGFVTFTVYNGTGADVTLGKTTVGSSTVVHVFDN